MIFTTKNKEFAIFGNTITDVKEKWKEFKKELTENNGKLFGENGALASLFSGKKLNFLTPEVLKQFDDFKEKFNSSSLSAEALAEQLENVDQRIIDYAKTCKNGEMTTEGFKASIDTMSFSAKAGKVALQALAIAGNMIAMWAISKGIELAVKGIDELAHSAEHCKERVDELMSSYKSALDKANGNAKTVEGLAAKYEQLSRGVNSLGQNVSLTADEYSEYNDIVNQIADMFPELIRGYTNEGNAILSLKGNVEQLRDAYKEAQQEAYNMLIVSGKDSDGNDIISHYKNTISNGSLFKFDSSAKEYIDIITELHDAMLTSDKAYEKLYKEMISDGKLYDSYNMSALQFRKVKETLSDIGFKPTVSSDDKRNINNNVEAYIQTYQAEINSALKNVRELANAYLMTNSGYESMNDDSKNAASILVNSITEDISTGFEEPVDVGAYVTNIVNAIKDNKGVENALIGMFQVDLSNMQPKDVKANIDRYVSIVGEAIGEKPIELKARLGFDDIDVIAQNYEAAMNKAAKKFSGQQKRPYGGSALYDAEKKEIEKFAKENSINTQDEIAFWNKCVEESSTREEAMRKYLEHNPQEAMDSTFNLTSHSEAIDSFQSKVKSLSDALTKLNNGEITSSDLTDLAQEFTSLDVASGTLASDIELLIYDSLRELYRELGNPPEGLKEVLAGIADEALEAAKGVSSLSSSIQSVMDTHSLMSSIRDDMEDGRISAANLQKIAASYEGMEEAVVAYSAGLIDSKELYAELEGQYGKDLDAFRAASQSKAYESGMYYSAVLGKEQALTDRMQKLYGIRMSEFRTAEEAKTAFLERSFGDREAIWDRYYRVVRGEDGTYEIRATGNLESLTGTNRTAIEKAKAKVQQFLDDLNRMFRADFDLAGMLGDEAEEAETRNNVIDWIEKRLDRIQSKLKKFGEAVSDAFSGYTDRKGALGDKINATVSEQLPALEEALEKYRGLANSVELRNACAMGKCSWSSARTARPPTGFPSTRNGTIRYSTRRTQSTNAGSH